MVLLRRSTHGLIHTSLVCLLLFLDFSILVGGILMISMVFFLQKRPNFSPGWMIIFLGLDTMVAGLTGMKRDASERLYIIHIVLTCVSAFGSGVLSLVLFSNKFKVISSFHSSRYTDAMMEKYLWSVAWAFLFLFVAEVLELLLALLVRHFSPVESYETLEQTQQHRTSAFFRARRDLGVSGDKTNTRQAKSLASKMKEKYGKWSHEQFG